MHVAVAKMIRAEQRAIHKLFIPGELLMFRAGAGVANVILENFNGVKRIGIASGFGNNGGDGFVAGLLLAPKVSQVDIVSLGKPHSFSNDAKVFLDLCGGKRNIKISFPTEISAISASLQHLRDCDLVIDALLGTGFRLPLKEPFVTAIRSINKGAPIVAVDIPSGLDGDTGAIAEECVRAVRTVTFARPKRGMVDRKQYTGDIDVIDIGIPDFCFDDAKWAAP